MLKNNVKLTISVLLQNRFDTIFYIPSSDEIMQINNFLDEKEFQQGSIPNFTESVHENTID